MSSEELELSKMTQNDCDISRAPHYLQLLAKSARMEGFTTLDFARRYEEARIALAQWIREGKLHYRDEVVEGIDQAPSHFLRLFRGDHRGKLMVKLADPEV